MTSAKITKLNENVTAEDMLLSQYPYNVTYEDIKAMDSEARNELYNDVVAILDRQPTGVQWDLAYEVFNDITAVNDAEYYEENIDRFNAWCKEHIWGKAWEDIDPETLDFYSDWYKDMYGYRPHRF